MNPINQRLIVENLNKYLEWHNLPLRVNKEGICNGLATIYVKYALQGKQADFVRILTKIAKKNSNPNFDDEINQFAVDIALTFMPHNYDKKLTQLNSINTQQIQGKTLKSSFNLAMTTSERNWKQILKEVELRKDEVMIVRGPGHTVSISKKNGNYVIYDPNYKSGFKSFTNEIDLLDELQLNVFHFKDKTLGMQIEVIRHPNKENTPRKFPNLDALYQKYLNIDKVARTSKINKTDFDWTLEMNNKKALDVLYEKGFKHKNIVIDASRAAAFNATEILPTLLKKITSEEAIDFQRIFFSALNHGRKEALNILLENERFKKFFSEQILFRRNVIVILNQTAEGGNVELMKKIIHDYQVNGKPEPASDQHMAISILAEPQTTGKNVIKTAIDSGSLDCVKFLYDQLKKYKPIEEKQLLSDLLYAVNSNQPNMVELFVNEINNLPPQKQTNLFQSIQMNTDLVKQTDLSILRTLKFHGVTFPKKAEEIIDLKENCPVVQKLSSGNRLNKFTDFVGSFFKSKESGLEEGEKKNNIKKFKEIKKQVSEHRNRDELEEQPQLKVTH